MDAMIPTNNLKVLAERTRAIAAKSGWAAEITEACPQLFGEKLMLVVAELSEAMEEFRKNTPLAEVYYRDSSDSAVLKPEGIPIELADAVIRILDLCEANGIDIVEAINVKLAYNATRSYRHGGKKA